MRRYHLFERRIAFANVHINLCPGNNKTVAAKNMAADDDLRSQIDIEDKIVAEVACVAVLNLYIKERSGRVAVGIEDDVVHPGADARDLEVTLGVGPAGFQVLAVLADRDGRAGDAVTVAVLDLSFYAAGLRNSS